MKKIIQGLLAVAAATSASLEATSTNKTFMADRGTLSNNVLMSRASGRACKGKKDGMGANISVTGFGRVTYKDSDIAKYFGTGTNALPDGAITVSAYPATTSTGALSKYIEPLHTLANGSLGGVVNMVPRRIEAGAQIGWTQSLSKFVKGLSFSVEAPIVYVRTEMRATYSPETASTEVTSNNNLSNYFQGTFVKTGSSTTPYLAALANQTIPATFTSLTGVADVGVTLSYRFVREKAYSFGAHIYGQVPTGSKNTGVVVFEPSYGRRNFFLGAGLDGRFNLWKSEDKASALNFEAWGRYSYGFSAADVRTLGLYSVANGSVAAGQYYGTFIVGDTHASPLANLSTLAVSVEPRSRLEAVAGLAYRYNRMTVNVAYNFFYAQKENVTLTPTWNEATSAITGSAVTGNVSTALVLAPADLSGTYALDLAACTTPAQVIHKVGGNVGYRFDTSVPMYVRAGGEIDVTANNQALSTWAVFGKFGFCF